MKRTRLAGVAAGSRQRRCGLAVVAWCSLVLGPSGRTTADAQSTDPMPWRADARHVQVLSAKGTEFNYREDQVPQYTLPDPLIAADETPIESAQQWHAKRRPELIASFRSEVYGTRPDITAKIDFQITSTDDLALGGTATAREVDVILTDGDRRFTFPVAVFVPKKSSSPTPAIVLINNRSFPGIQPQDPIDEAFWPVAELIDRGYAAACFHTSDVDPDRPDGYGQGVRGFVAAGAPPEDSAWRSLSAWGWAASRVADYLSTLPSIDAERIAVVGHSRGGKAALWAAAEDPRFGIVYSNQSGCGGAALSRRAYGETVRRITEVFPHWFVPRFATYGNRESDLPIDQHQLIALIAPRSVYVVSADEDLWADPRGEYTSLVAAAPVYELLGRSAISDPVMPPIDQPTVVGNTGYHVRSGPHDLTRWDWQRFLDFVDTHWGE